MIRKNTFPLCRILLLLTVVIVLSSCLSLEQRYTNAAENVIELINAGNVEALSDMTKTPFILDGEILLLAEDTTGFWRDITEAGFRIANPSLIEVFPVDSSTYEHFGGSMEVETFFKKYVSKKGNVAIVETEKASIWFLLEITNRKKTRLLGFKGPIQK